MFNYFESLKLFFQFFLQSNEFKLPEFNDKATIKLIIIARRITSFQYLRITKLSIFF